MRLQTKQFLAAIGMLLAVMSARGLAQPNLPFGPENYSHDFQLFAPVELDLDNEPFQDDYGYWAGYSKLAWSFTGERTEVGDPNVVVFSEEIYRDNGAPTDVNGPPPPPYQIFNGLQDVFPKAGFAAGDRYEIGYRDRGNGWMIGILDGPELSQGKVYGMGPTPVPDADYNGPTTGPYLPPFGFGNVHINFDTPVGYLQGFRDYLNLFAGAAIGTQVGPIVYIGNIGGQEEPDPDDGTIDFQRLTDDINENGIFGAAIVIVVGPDGVPRVSTLTDFGDLHTFNIAFDNVAVRTRTKTNGVEAMWSHEMTNRHYQAKHQNNRIELSAGARFLQLEDFFSFEGISGGVLGNTFSDTWLDNQIVGPQVRAVWTNQRQRWRFKADTRFVFGYNIQDWHQENGVGLNLVPGATNRLLYAQPTYSTHGLQRTEFSPVGELRLESAYYLTQNIALKVGYTGMYVGNIRRAAQSVKYYLPDMGFRDSGTQNFISNGVDVGVDFVY